MKPPYTPAELDAFLRAAVEAESEVKPQFYSGEVAGHAGVNPDVDAVKRMAEWLAATDDGLVENLGIGRDNITYFRLGLQAKAVLADGGMGRYLQRKQRAERLEKSRTWLPIGISTIAIIFTALTYFGPKGTGRRLDALERDVAALKIDAAAHIDALNAARARADTVDARFRELQRPPRRR